MAESVYLWPYAGGAAVVVLHDLPVDADFCRHVDGYVPTRAGEYQRVADSGRAERGIGIVAILWCNRMAGCVGEWHALGGGIRQSAPTQSIRDLDQHRFTGGVVVGYVQEGGLPHRRGCCHRFGFDFARAGQCRQRFTHGFEPMDFDRPAVPVVATPRNGKNRLSGAHGVGTLRRGIIPFAAGIEAAHAG